MLLANPRMLGLLGASAVAAVGYAVVAARVRRGRTREADAEARRSVMRHASPRAKRLAEATGHIGKWYTYVPTSAAGAIALGATGRHAAAGTLAAAAASAVAAARVLDRVHQHRTPPPGKTRIEPDAQSFPSGHALETTAVAVAAAWVLAREQVAPAKLVIPAAVLASLISGVGRLVLDRHWSTDSLAGYLAGVALGTACASGYELAREL